MSLEAVKEFGHKAGEVFGIVRNEPRPRSEACRGELGSAKEIMIKSNVID
jgi:hypothetical protein